MLKIGVGPRRHCELPPRVQAARRAIAALSPDQQGSVIVAEH